MLLEAGVGSVSLVRKLKDISKKTPERLAVVSADFQCTYRELECIVAAQADALDNHNISSSSIVGILASDNITHFILTIAACVRGARIFTIPSYEPEHVQQSLVEKCQATHVVDASFLIPVANGVNERPCLTLEKSEAGSSFLFATSGTTGDPKLVLHFDTDIVAQAHRHVNSESERFACLAVMEHNFAKRHRLYCLAQGATNVFVDESRDIVEQCLNLDVNVLHLSVFQVQQLLAHPKCSQLGHVRVKLGGSHVTSSLRKQIKANITPQLQAGYGTTETGAIGFTEPDESVLLETVGRPLPGIEIRIQSPEGKMLSSGHRGEILIRAKGMFRGYLNRPELSAERLKDGWFSTGDIGYLDEQNRLYLAGRVDDMFVFNSINIYPQDIETCLLDMPDVVDVSVVAKPSSVHGNIPVAFVVPAQNKQIDLRELKKKAQDALGLRCPRQFIPVEELPRNKSGKIDRSLLKSLSCQPGQVRSAIVDTLSSYEANWVLKKGMLNKFEQGVSDLRLEDLNLESIVVVALLVLFEIEFDTIVTPQTFVALGTLNRVAAYVVDNTGNAAEKEGDSPNREYVELVDKPYLLRFFQRILSCTDSTATLNKALDSLEHRLTPTEFSQLHTWFRSNQLVPTSISNRHFIAVHRWFTRLFDMIPDTEKNVGKKYQAKRISPAIWLYYADKNVQNKTLIICFAPLGTRKLVLPTPVFLHYINDSRYDLMVVGDPTARGYEKGVPLLGGDELAVIKSIAQIKQVGEYKEVQTVGCSAGAHMAIALAYHLGATQSLSIGGRFHKERYPHRILKRLLMLWFAIKRNKSTRIILCYSARVSRDRIFAKLIARLSGGTRFAVKTDGGKFSHQVIDQISEMGSLNEFLSATMFEPTDQLSQVHDRELAFPSGNINKLKD